MVNQHIRNHGLGIFGVVRFDLGAPRSRSNKDSQTKKCL